MESTATRKDFKKVDSYMTSSAEYDDYGDYVSSRPRDYEAKRRRGHSNVDYDLRGRDDDHPRRLYGSFGKHKGHHGCGCKACHVVLVK